MLRWRRLVSAACVREFSLGGREQGGRRLHSDADGRRRRERSLLRDGRQQHEVGVLSGGQRAVGERVQNDSRSVRCRPEQGVLQRRRRLGLLELLERQVL